MTRILARESTSNLRRSQAPIMVIIGILTPESAPASWAAQLAGLAGSSAQSTHEAALHPSQAPTSYIAESPPSPTTPASWCSAISDHKIGLSVHMFTELSVHMFTETDLPCMVAISHITSQDCTPVQSMIYWPFGHSTENFKFSFNHRLRRHVMVTITLRVRNHPDVSFKYADLDTAITVLKACLDLPASEITGWSLTDHS